MPIALSVIAAAHDEEDNVGPLIAEIEEALDPTGLQYEILVVDDGSRDGTPAVLESLLAERPRLRVLRLRDATPAPRDRGGGHGQSAALHAGIRAARGELVAMIDADLQNDPADIPRLVETLRREDADLVQGDRRARRRDGPVRRASSGVGRIARRLLLGDRIGDTGCSLRVMRRAAALQLPLEFSGMHRFIPVTCRHLGYRVIERPVRHRARAAGRSKYGIRNRAWSGFVDCFAVLWMRSRRRLVDAEVRTSAGSRPAPASEPKQKAKL